MKIPLLIKGDQTYRTNEKTSEKAATQRNDAFRDETQDMEDVSFPHYKRVSDYLLGTCIGEGAFAKVRVGLHCPTKEKVAIKVINKLEAKKDRYVFKNLHREGRLMQMLRHPNIVQVYEILETGNNYYLVTELCSGGELIDIVGEKGYLSEGTVCKYVCQLVKAVTYMHERKIVHRDLKVENLLLDSEDNLKIIDFGLSNVVSESCSDISCALQTQCGSPGYAAPELLARKAYGPKVDVWSIGIITYALLVGKLPYTVDPLNIPKLCKKMMKGEMNPIPSHISPQCKKFIQKLLSPKYEHRPTIHDVMKMKWISTFLKENQKPSNTFSSTLLKDRLPDEASLRQSNLSLAHNTLSCIDSAIIEKMVTLYGFLYSDVIRCVHKNRPGSVLVTYQLLKKRERRNSQRANNKSFVQAILRRADPQKYKSEAEPTVSNPLKDRFVSLSTDSTSSGDDSHSAEIFDGLVSPTPSQPNLGIPEKSAKAPPCHDKQQLQYDNEEHNKVSLKNELILATDKEAIEKEELADNLSRFASCHRLTPPHVRFLGNGIAPNKNLSTKRQGTEDSKRNKISEVVNSSCSNTIEHEPTSNRNRSTEINKLLTSTKKAKKRKQIKVSKPNKQVEPVTAVVQHDTREVLSKNKPQESLPNVSLTTSSSPQKSSHMLSSKLISIHPPRNLLQQRKKKTEEFFNKSASLSRNAPRGPRNSALGLPEIANSVLPNNRPTFTPSFKQRPKLGMDDAKETLRQTTKPKPPNYTAEKKFTTLQQLGLPMIVTKPIWHDRIQGQNREVHRSLSITTGSQQVSQSLSITPSQSKKTVSVKNDVNVKLSIPLRLQKRQHLESNDPLINHEQGRCSNRCISGHASQETNKPRKVISKPIAAAISHLTSTKNRTFAEEKDILLPTD